MGSIIAVQGELVKIGRRTSLNQRRYCIVRDQALFVYKDQSSQLPLEIIYLKGMQIRTNVRESLANIP